MDPDHRVKDLVRQLIHHLQTNPNPNPNPSDVNYAIRILSSRITPHTLTTTTTDTIATSIKTHLAKQSKLSHALTFTDLYSQFANKTGPGSVTNKQSLLYLLKLISQHRSQNPNPQINPTFTSHSKFKNGGVLTIVKSPNNITCLEDFDRLVDGESDVAEEDLVIDLLDVCEGNDGKYVGFDESVDGYVVLGNVKVLKGTKVMVLKLCELGWLYRKVDRYVGENTGGTGTVGEAFCVALRDELVEYRKLITVLKLESRKPKGCLSLRRLAVWFVEPMVKMRRMAVVVDGCKGMKGGAMAGVIYLYGQHGDPLLRGLMKRLLVRVCFPLFEMVRRWVMEGDLQDLCSEFFVSEESVKPECLWKDGYRIRYPMLPCFVSESLAKRILRTGKSINFLKVCCDDHSLADLATGLAMDDTSTNALESLVTKAENRIDKHLMYVIFKRYKFRDHCLGIKRFILLGQGDFVQYLMEIVGPVLSEPAKSISLIQLSGLVEKAIQSSSAQYDDRDILDRVKVKLMPHGVKDKGWDVFCLDYVIRAPLNTVFTESVMGSYLRIFSFLWKIKRVEHAVLGAWKTMKPNLASSQFFTKLPKGVKLQVVLTSRRCQLLLDEMNNFVTSLQAYVMFEVLEVTWSKFCSEMAAAKDLDDLIAAHDKYLARIVEKALLGENSETLYKTLLMLFDVILRFASVADRLYEFRTRDTTSKTKKTSKSKGLETDPWLNEGRKAVTQRAGEFLSVLGQDLDAVSKEYSSILKGFVSQLPTQQHVDLKFLMLRLDFTEFYRSTT